MPRPRFENVEPAKRARLLEAAMKEFAAHGYELASMNRILETAGFSKGSFYYYFEDKADLAATTLIAASEELEMRDHFRPVATAEEFWTEMRRTSIDRLRLLVANRTHYECVVRLSNALVQEPQLAERMMPMFEDSRQKIAGFLERGVAVGALRSDLPMGTLIMLVEAAKMTLYKAMFPDESGIPGEPEMESFNDLVLDLAQRIGAPK